MVDLMAHINSKINQSCLAKRLNFSILVYALVITSSPMLFKFD